MRKRREKGKDLANENLPLSKKLIPFGIGYTRWIILKFFGRRARLCDKRSLLASGLDYPKVTRKGWFHDLVCWGLRFYIHVFS